MTAVTQEKHLLFLHFDLFCRFFWILSLFSFFPFFPCSVVVVDFSSHIFYCYKLLTLCCAFAVLLSVPFTFFYVLIFFQFFKPIIFSTLIPLFVFPTVLIPLQLIYINLLYLPLFNFAYLFLLSFSPFLSTYLLVLFSLLYSPHGTLL